MKFSRLRNKLRDMPKWRLFGLLVVVAALFSGAASVVTYFTVLEGAQNAPVRFVLIAPLSGPDAGIGASMRSGVEEWIADKGTRRGGPGGHRVELSVYDEATEPDAARKAAADPAVVGVIGPFGREAAARARPVLTEAGIPALTLASLPGGADASQAQTMFELLSRPESEARFLANYVRNVLGERLVSIILPNDADSQALDQAFDEVLQRFGTKVVYRWTAPADGGPAQAAGLKAAAQEIQEKKIAGTILILGPQSFAANAMLALRAGDVTNRIVGNRLLATNAFRQSLQAAWRQPSLVDGALNGALVTVPVLFDTAGVAAQAFRDGFVARTGHQPDWLSVLAYDAASFIGTSLAAKHGGAEAAGVSVRQSVLKEIIGANSAEHAFTGLAGPLFFDRKANTGVLPELVGTYDGRDLVSALTQLSPIREQGVYNYLEELAAGRVLYVNDRFMYRTNVVYAGVQLEKVLDLNAETNIADLEFVIWFRWRGTLDPQNVVFPNALAPIQLANPERDGKSGDFSYRSYRVRGKFYLNYSDEPHRFGTQVVEVKFRHRTLSRNNLMYVTDVLGMGLNSDVAGTVGADDFLHKLFGTRTSESVLTRQLRSGRVLAGVSGWLVDRAWFSQEIGQASSGGDPVYVGFGKPVPLFSTIDIGLVVKPDAFDPGGLVPANWYIYIAIFAFSMSLLANTLDRKDRGHFWRIQTLLLRIVAWPVLLASTSNLVLDYAQDNLTPSSVGLISDVIGMLWWLVPAQLLLISVERFLWVPLENSTGRKIPTVFRMIVDMIIYVLAGFGIVAFVLGKTITSLLAGSGVLAMIVGLALQSNLKDIFSGIMLNLERPFVISDFLRMNRTIARVIDVSWRTTRLETDTGSIIALPNSRVSESEIENLSTQRVYEVVSTVMLDPSYPPEAVVAALREAGTGYPFPVKIARATGLSKIEKVGEAFVATYTLTLEVSDFPTSKKLRAEVMQKIWHSLRKAGIGWNGPAKASSAGGDTLDGGALAAPAE